MIKKISIIPNLSKKGSGECAVKLAEILKNVGVEVFAEDSHRNVFAGVKVNFVPRERVYAEAQAVVVLGGDGTVISAAKRGALTGIPVLGVNFGKVGYIAELEENEIELAAKLADGDYTVEERMMLDAEVYKGDRRLFYSLAFNEVAVTRGSVSKLADFNLYCGDKAVSRYRADGLIVATPTGSTAYSLAAGGPVIDPSFEAFCVTPICSHSLVSARSLIFTPQSEIRVKVPSSRYSEAVLTADGKTYFKINDPEVTVVVKKSDKLARLIKLKPFSFYDTLYRKFDTGE